MVLLGKREYYDEVLSVVKSLMDASGERKLKIDLTAYENGNNHITAKPLGEEDDDSSDYGAAGFGDNGNVTGSGEGTPAEGEGDGTNPDDTPQ